jgi:hypothetical protein
MVSYLLWRVFITTTTTTTTRATRLWTVLFHVGSTPLLLAFSKLCPYLTVFMHVFALQ